LKIHWSRDAAPLDPFLHALARRATCRVPITPLESYLLAPGVKVTLGLRGDGEPVYCVDESLGRDDCDSVAEATAYSIASAALMRGREDVDAVFAEMLDNVPEDEEAAGCSKLESFNAFTKYLAAKIVTGYGPLYPLILDPGVEEIALDPPGYMAKIIHRRLGDYWIETNIVVERGYVDRFVRLLARRSGRELSIAHPYVEGLLPEGHRLAATLGREVTRYGSSLVVRKHRQRPLSLAELVASGSFSLGQAVYLWQVLELKASMLVVGPTASGKTTVLQALLDLVPPWSRVVSVEDTPELNLSHLLNWDSLVARPVYGGEGEDVDLYKLARFALRRRPDYLVIGEVRGEEARVLVYAASSGHAALSTFHAESAEGAVRRLRRQPFELDDAMLASIKVMIVLGRSRGRRVLRGVYELGYDASSDSLLVRAVPADSDYRLVVQQSDVLQSMWEGALDELVVEMERKADVIRSSRSREELLSNIKSYYYGRLGEILEEHERSEA